MHQGNVKNSKKIVNTEQENLHIFQIFSKDVADDNIKGHKKQRLYPFSEKHIFGKTTGGVKLTPLSHPTPNLELKDL